MSKEDAKQLREIFAKNLKKIRGTTTQDVFAQSIGVSKSILAKYETAASFPGVDVLVKISQVYNVSIDSLLDNSINDDVKLASKWSKILSPTFDVFFSDNQFTLCFYSEEIGTNKKHKRLATKFSKEDFYFHIDNINHSYDFLTSRILNNLAIDYFENRIKIPLDDFLQKNNEILFTDYNGPSNDEVKQVMEWRMAEDK